MLRKTFLGFRPPTTSFVSSALSEMAQVSLVNSSQVRLAAVEADIACGSGTRLILYMAPGEVLSRSFTSKDTHSPTGELLVMYTDVSRVSRAHVKRSMASALLLGFQPPSFTFGTDLILPVEANEHLRVKLIEYGLRRGVQVAKDEDLSHFKVIQSMLESIRPRERGYVSIHIPEVRSSTKLFELACWYKST